MKRAFLFAFLILVIDQGLKTYFQLTQSEVYFGYFGFHYVQNEALWINPNLKNHHIYIIFLYAFIVWILAVYLLHLYHKRFRTSIIVDIAFGFYTTGIIGNMIDKLCFGYIRDFFVTPYVICNLADICGFIGIIIFSFEFIFYPKSRVLLNLNH